MAWVESAATIRTCTHDELVWRTVDSFTEWTCGGCDGGGFQSGAFDRDAVSPSVRVNPKG